MSQENANEAVEYIDAPSESFLTRVPSWLVSMVVHTVLLLVMALTMVDTKTHKAVSDLVSTPTDETVIEDPLEEEDFEMEEIDLDVTDVEVTEVTQDVTTAEVSVESNDEPAPAMVQVDPIGNIKAQASSANTSITASYSGGGMGLRKNATATALRSGGSTESEKAVALGLQWIARHQYPDGSWNYNHTMAPNCKGKCSGPGSLMKATNAATAMGILPFLGCGQTHKEGKYKQQVYAGLNYLCMNIKPDKKIGGGSLRQNEGTMYGHGLAAICLTEAYAMTKDKKLMMPAQLTVNFIQGAQDPAGGGWRYSPRQAGDTSVVGWQMMALKSGYMGYLKVSPQVAQNAMRFLDSVQQDSGSYYGYVTPGKAPACTAIGLLCRMYYGWKHDHPALQRGVEYLSKLGPTSDPYYNYYATQVMRHFGGEHWRNWNARMRDKLVQSQSRQQDSHELGSWPSGGGHGAQGGRLYSTAMSVMTLEVYYRHMPIYSSQGSEGGLPLE
ncbi:MAG: terpene cyclase/mutase family protein [Planctomycetia bacterium]|nr:terpene cyclase/mutase family protein [Planctomycetia bacterium]